MSATLDSRSALERARDGELLGPGELAEIFGIGPQRFSTLRAAGQFARFEVKPRIGRKCYSGVLVYRYVTGQPLYEPTFGRKQPA